MSKAITKYLDKYAEEEALEEDEAEDEEEVDDLPQRGDEGRDDLLQAGERLGLRGKGRGMML